MSVHEIINPDGALIFRIVHYDNLPLILQNGLRCANSLYCDPSYIAIGNSGLIQKRQFKVIPIPPRGTLSDYVPFYFTPISPMMLNIVTGHNGIVKRDKCDILIIVSSIQRLEECNIRYVLSDRHAYLATAQFFSDRGGLNSIDWDLLKSSNFRRDPNDPEKVERYQAEALAHRHVPVEALLGVACYDDQVKARLDRLMSD